MKKLVCFLIISAFTAINVSSQYVSEDETLPKALTEEESLRLHEIGLNFTPTIPPDGVVRSIAEFERNQGVLVRYPLALPVDLIEALTEHVEVVVLVANNNLKNEAAFFFETSGVHMENIRFLVRPTDSVWTRDYGPFYMLNEQDEISIVDFIYNRPRPLDDAIPLRLAEFLEIPHYGMNMVHTGGNYMTDSYGASASTDLIWEENTISESKIMSLMLDFLNIKDYHVTIDPQNSAIKHIDTWAKFLNVDKILIARVPPTHPRYEDHELVVEYFENAVSPWGTNYSVYRVDTPNGQPYTNSLIVNERVYVPLMNSVWDSAAIEAYEEAMPGYEVLGFLGLPSFNWNSQDAIHCRVKEIPDTGMLSLRHIPQRETIVWTEELTFYADINAYNGLPLIDDELYLIYSINDAPFDTLNLNHIDESIFEAVLSLPQDAQEVHYYFSASDESGRVEHYPLVGKRAPISFQVENITSAETQESPLSIELHQNYPNPFNPSTVIGFELPESGYISLDIYSINGQKVSELANGNFAAGSHSIVFDGSDLASGIYLYRLVTEFGVITKQMVLVK